MSTVIKFQEEYPSLESYWRSIILFGINVASYKFALSKSLLEIAPTGKSVITLEELSEPFSKHMCEHLLNANKQSTSSSSQFLDACREYNKGVINKEQLLDITYKNGFTYVIDAFHVVNKDEIPIKFYEKDYSKGHKKIILTDNIFKLQNFEYYNDLLNETEARWNLVETSWELGISSNLLNIKYNDFDQRLYVDDTVIKRQDITSARDALNGYQKGKCFYCFDNITVNTADEQLCDVDHFFPHAFQRLSHDINLDGVWNLVLACKNCNRGEDGKFAQVPAVKYLERLHKRNEFLINSHHPLRETIMQQTGQTEAHRKNFLQNMDKHAINILIHRWDTEPIGPATF